MAKRYLYAICTLKGGKGQLPMMKIGGVLNNEDIKGHILSGSLWELTASGLFKKACPAEGSVQSCPEAS
ncbi:MAG: hypothetical protein KC545_06760 [Nitrospira sp.]|nr:hypothetical protein [Nitrospira sp.]